MRVFALFRLKKYGEPLEINLTRHEQENDIDFYDGTALKDFDKDREEIVQMKMAKMDLLKKSQSL